MRKKFDNKWLFFHSQYIRMVLKNRHGHVIRNLLTTINLDNYKKRMSIMVARNTFSRVLKKIRVSKGYSQEGLAFEAGLSMRSISLLEGNKQQPTITTIENLSKALGMKMSEFITQIEAEIN